MPQYTGYDLIEDDEKDQLILNNFLNPGESTKNYTSILRDTIVRIQNDSDTEDGYLLVKGFNKNFKKIIKPSSLLEFRISGTLKTDKFVNIGNTRLIITTDSAKDAPVLNSCKVN
ncbi:hypothetical protein DICPUDRAFT_84389 [Dictyostelium purpureum]|uniref:Uncharacterized protein n=1 Tax=Dictyostelium purpureum TaxID=5786 RepID=F1A2H9_DICPU|nr:uncharacterized protein DICPUDRAFT_84389 [Dictyostelium purpureum]EGC29600.1 hypothetical protein DICPUDRAFT_84389 [Dictyostelium purpureum]|eukprot:XP_003293868.1 hypothetical protein DICPUDRAFT_84389 [Dictyostelium purpureum]